MSSAADVLGLVGSTVSQIRFDAFVDAGGFGLVYRGHHMGLGETVAIKCLQVGHLTKRSEGLRESLEGRFHDETKILYRLSQGCLDIVRCLTSGTLTAPRDGSLVPYMVLEWLDGRPLSADLRDRKEKKVGGRSLPEAIALLDSAAHALAYAHGQGVLHRDIKPGNLFLTNTLGGVRTKVLDFGLAKIFDDEILGIRPSVETGAGVHFCSPSYGAPEQLTSKFGTIGPATDIYSLTLVLLELLTGEKVRPAVNLADGLAKVLDPRGTPKLGKLGLSYSRGLEEFLDRATSTNPELRPKDIARFWSQLKALANAEPQTGKTGDLGATAFDTGVESAMEQVRALRGSGIIVAPMSPLAASSGAIIVQSGPVDQPGASPFAISAGIPDGSHLLPISVSPSSQVSPLAASIASSPPPPMSGPPSRPPTPSGHTPPRAVAVRPATRPITPGHGPLQSTRPLTPSNPPPPLQATRPLTPGPGPGPARPNDGRPPPNTGPSPRFGSVPPPSMPNAAGGAPAFNHQPAHGHAPPAGHAPLQAPRAHGPLGPPIAAPRPPPIPHPPTPPNGNGVAIAGPSPAPTSLPSPPTSSSNIGLALLVFLVSAALGGAAIWWFMLRTP